MRTVEWYHGHVRLIDQTRLPQELAFIDCPDYQAVAESIRSMRVRGAPAIGVAAAMGCALGALRSQAETVADLLQELERVTQALAATRPTAINLGWAVERMTRKAQALQELPLSELKAALIAEAKAMAEEDVAVNRSIGRHGAELIPPDGHVLTICNTGALAAVDVGTALGVVRTAHQQGKRPHVYVAETRPRLQGARLTAWELLQEGIPFTLITDSMAGHFMARGAIDLVISGADRIAANGDTANKIGTYTLAVLAKEHNLPFCVAAPLSSVDWSRPDGLSIPIEERPADEITHIAGQPVAPPGVTTANPAFDLTPARYIHGIITEHGIAQPPYEESLKALLAERKEVVVEAGAIAP